MMDMALGGENFEYVLLFRNDSVTKFVSNRDVERRPKRGHCGFLTSKVKPLGYNEITQEFRVVHHGYTL